MQAIELLQSMERNMEGVQTISVPYHISQIKEAIIELEQLQAENEHLSNTVESTRQDYADLLDGTIEAKLQAENASLKEIADLALDIHTRDKLYVKEKWGVMGINAEKLLVRKIEDLTEE